VPQSAR